MKNTKNIRNVWLYALRYAMTRNTGAMLQVASEIIFFAEDIEVREREQILEECIDHIRMYDNHYSNKSEIEDVINTLVILEKKDWKL